MDKVRGKQPQVIMNNRLFRIPEAGFSGMGTNAVTARMDPQYGDFVTPEQHIPDTGLGDADWETCMTMNTSWGFNRHDSQWKPSRTLIRNLVDIASKGGNYLLNIGPTGDGSVPPESVERMAAIGRWMKTNGESIYGTTASPIGKPGFDGRITRREDTHYLHVFAPPADGTLRVKLPGTKATLLADGSSLEVTREGGEAFVRLPASLPDADATVIRLD